MEVGGQVVLRHVFHPCVLFYGDSLVRKVDWGSVEYANLTWADYPDLVDAFIQYAEWEDGTPLTEQELIDLEEQYADECHELAIERFHCG